MKKSYIIIIAVIGVSLILRLILPDTDREYNYSKTIIKGKPVEYNGETYETVVIGNQTWLKKNLNIKTNSGSLCYGEDGEIGIEEEDKDKDRFITLTSEQIQVNCNKYGRLYDWGTAMDLPNSCNKTSCQNQIKEKHKGICPEGFHIPTKIEFEDLVYNVEEKENRGKLAITVGTKLKSVEGWHNCGTPKSGKQLVCTDIYGFTALPGGEREWRGNKFYYAGYEGTWWSADETNKDRAYAINLIYGVTGMQSGSDNFKSSGYSIRCVKD